MVVALGGHPDWVKEARGSDAAAWVGVAEGALTGKMSIRASRLSERSLPCSMGGGQSPVSRGPRWNKKWGEGTLSDSPRELGCLPSLALGHQSSLCQGPQTPVLPPALLAQPGPGQQTPQHSIPTFLAPQLVGSRGQNLLASTVPPVTENGFLCITDAISL